MRVLAARHRTNPAGRTIDWAGYAMLGKNAIDNADLAMFDAMRHGSGRVKEHRWVMAKILGRALRSDELVDHMNGCKTDSSPENLRMYIRGKQQPGSAPGHGTYYDEWQRAEARVRELEALLAASRLTA